MDFRSVALTTCGVLDDGEIVRLDLVDDKGARSRCGSRSTRRKPSRIPAEACRGLGLTLAGGRDRLAAADPDDDEMQSASMGLN